MERATLGGVTDSFGNITAQMGFYINIIGETHELNDVWFKVDFARTIDLNEVIFLEGMENYPEISGFGNVTNFSQALANDASGKLHDLVLRFSSADDYSQRKLILNDIIFFWSGVSGFSTGSRGYYIDDARKVYALEAFLGQQLRQSTGINSGTSDPGPNAAAVLMKAYDQLAIYVDAMLMLQTRFSSYVGKVDFYFKGEEGFAVDVVALVLELYESYQVDPVGVTESIRSFSSSLLAVGGDLGAQVVAELRSAGGEESIGFYFVLSSLGPFLGEGGDDELYGDTGDDTLLGLGGDDIIYGGSGNDLIDGGAGDDYLSGDAGADIYSFSVSWGQDVINNADAVLGRPDKIVFDGTVSSENIILRRSADNLIIRSAISDDMITVVNYFASEGFGVYSLSEIRFADGLVWQWAEVKAITSASTEGDDELHGFDAVDIIKAGAGNDLLYGNGGDDLLFGGRGNDEIYGGEGSDVYSFELGDGFDSVVEEGRSIFDVDVLVFGSGVYASDIKFSLSGVSLVLAHDNGFDKVTIKNWFQSSSGQYQIERVEFADGTFWSSTSLSAQLKEFSGTAGDDTYDGGSFPLDLLVSGDAGNDTLSTGKGSDQLRGGQGSDTLTGGAGSDTYLFELRDGQDVIHDDAFGTSGSIDVLRFGEGISSGDFAAVFNGNDLVLSHANGVDKVTVKNWLAATTDRYKVERIEFANGVLWTDAQVQRRAGTADADVIVGLAGDDRLHGGKGNDQVSGGDGNDTYVFATGDGVDYINNSSAAPSDIDVLEFQSIDPSKLWFSRSGNDLLIDVVGSSDQVNVSGWYSSDSHQLDIIKSGEAALYANAVDSLVSAMAGFGPASGGELTLTQQQRDQVDVLIAANWK
ncbi:hypothetical protein K5D32_19560 [Pseudomonas cichorii]|uniref:calcium-binding protein n=1 Tax=Pseudomonas cichorii TaxID=36746 RepID=UPI001C8A6E03|nr:calcium-binding protein [Pseudomonas cichorii]MBX8531875.1 hypothetical protein [Pseudomonas cichorii]